MELANRVTLVCFAASYAVALGLEVWRHFRPREIVRKSVQMDQANWLRMKDYTWVARLVGVGSKAIDEFVVWILSNVPRFEQTAFRFKAIVDGHPGDAGLVCDGVDAEAARPFRAHQDFPGGGEDSRPGLLPGCLPAAQSVGAQAHKSP